MKISNYNLKGFTFPEFLVNILIVSALLFSVLEVFNALNQEFDIEENRTDVINYANKVLDEISEELIAAYEVRKRTIINNTNLQFLYPNTEEITRIWVNTNYGFTKNDTLMAHFFKRDDLKRIKYEIKKFELNEPVLYAGDIWSESSNRAREASYEIFLEIDLFDKFDNKIETLQFNRRVFSPTKFIYSSTSI